MHNLGGWLNSEGFQHRLEDLSDKLSLEQEQHWPGPWYLLDSDESSFNVASSEHSLQLDDHLQLSQTQRTTSLQNQPLSHICHIDRYSLRDQIGKKRLYLYLFSLENHPHQLYLLPQPMRGYEKDFRIVGKRLLTLPTLQIANFAQLQLALTEGLVINAKPAMLDNPLWNLLQDLEVRKKRLGSLPHLELLHQFRVAIRRTRSLLKQQPISYPKLDKQLKKMMKATNHSRDLDVFLEQRHSLVQRLPDKLQPALQAFLKRLIELNAQEQKQLFKSLRHSKPLVDLLQTPEPEATQAEATDRTAEPPQNPIDLASILSSASALIQALPDNPEDEAIHQIRISLKQVRYLLEMSPKANHEEGQQLLKQLKPLQDRLGEFNDRCVQRTELAALLQQHEVSKPQTKAVNALINILKCDSDQLKPLIIKELQQLTDILESFQTEENL